MNYETLINGYKQILSTIYAPKHFYERIMTLIKEYKPRQTYKVSQIRLHYLIGFLKSIWILGVIDKGRRYYWKLFLSTLFKRPKLFPLSMSLSVYGLHFRKVIKKFNKTSTVEPQRDLVNMKSI
jgi:hypothetical protein